MDVQQRPVFLNDVAELRHRLALRRQVEARRVIDLPADDRARFPGQEIARDLQPALRRVELLDGVGAEARRRFFLLGHSFFL
ncbi:MAG: hypothetical protein WDN72_00190 [Alphaproteobacteria bacterium]